MKRIRTIVSIGTSIAYLFSVLLISKTVEAQPTDVKNMCEQGVSISPEIARKSMILPGEVTDPTTILSQHFSNQSAEAQFYSFLNQDGYQALLNQAALFSLDNGSVLVVPVLKGGSIQNPIEAVIHVTTASEDTLLLYQLFYDETNYSVVKEKILDPSLQSGIEINSATGSISKFSNPAIQASSGEGFFNCLVNNLTSTGSLCGYAAAVITKKVLEGLLALKAAGVITAAALEPIAKAIALAVAGAVVVTFVCGAVQCVYGGGVTVN